MRTTSDRLESNYEQMKISLYELNALSDNEKAQVVLEHGTHLKISEEDGYIINLYSLSDFYVEIWYDASATSQKI